MPDKFAGSSADYSAAICRVGRPGCFSQTIREEGDESHEAGRLPNRRLSHELLMKFTIDTLGRCVDVQYPDSLGGVRFNPTQRSRELLNTALSELNPFTPAYKDGRKIPYVRKMLINMNFLPGAFVKPTFRGKKDGLMAFREYLNRNLVYDTKLYEAGVYGTVRVEFYIELTAQSLWSAHRNHLILH